MKPSDELFKLIKSLAKSEKRFFKLSSSLQSGDKNYLKLFDAIEQQIQYDESEIKEMFRDERFISHLPSEKNHLYKLILKSLSAYHSENSVVSQLQGDIKNVGILFRRMLYKEAGKILNKSKKLAYSHERFYYLFELINWEKKLLEEEYREGNFDKDLEELITEERIVLEKLQNLAEYRILYSRINFVFRKGGYARNEAETKIVEDIRNHPLIKGKNTAKSKSAAATCYYIQGLCAVVNYDYPTSFDKFSKVVSIFEDNSNIIAEIPDHYFRALSNLLFCHIKEKKFDVFFETLEKIRGLENQQGFTSPDIKMKLFTSTYNAELVAYDLMGEYEKGLKIIDDIVVGIDQFHTRITKEDEILFYYNIAYFYYGSGQLKNALKWINKIINDNEQQLRQDVYNFARLFSFVIHYDLGNYDLLDYMSKSVNRYYLKRRKDSGRGYRFETVFIKQLKKIAKVAEDSDKSKQLFAELRRDLIMVSKNDYEKMANQYFDYFSWIDSKMEGVTFATVRKRKALEKV